MKTQYSLVKLKFLRARRHKESSPEEHSYVNAVHFELRVIKRQQAKRWATNRAWKYRIVSSKLVEYIGLNENQTVDNDKSEHGESDIGTSIVHNQNNNNIDPTPKPSYTQPQAEAVVVGEVKSVEKQDQPTDEEVKEVCIQLRRLSPDMSINPQVKSAIRSFWHNVPAGLARVKNAIAQGWCKQPTGLFVQTLKDGVCEDKEVVVVVKEYPRPTLEQLNQLGEMGELVYTKLNEPGYPEVVAINTGEGVLTKVGSVRGGTGVIKNTIAKLTLNLSQKVFQILFRHLLIYFEYPIS